MRYDQLFLKTTKDAKEFDSVNATLLQKGGFISQTMAGVYTFLPLGWRVLSKIENIVREEMDTIAAEIFMPAISPRTLWETTKRADTIDVLLQATPANEASKNHNDAEYILNCTHEELITPIAKKVKQSYRDFPFAVYQIQTKFRNEERPKSGILRGREFRMKDLYSFHTSDEDRTAFYERAKEVYMNVFNRLGIGEKTVIALASGGDFTSDYSHEFQTRCESGEDEIYYDEKNDTYYNKEVAPEDVVAQNNVFAASEVGNIFPLGTKFTSAFEYTFTDNEGKAQPIYMASYGIGTSRVMGVIVENSHDDAGIIWPQAIAPFTVYLANLHPNDEETTARAEALYKQLTDAGVDVLYDDRKDAGPGQKLADADLIGVPWRAVVSQRNADTIELKQRTAKEASLVSIEEVLTAVRST